MGTSGLRLSAYYVHLPPRPVFFNFSCVTGQWNRVRYLKAHNPLTVKVYVRTLCITVFTLNWVWSLVLYIFCACYVHNIYQVAAQCFYLLIIAPTCFGLSYRPSTESLLVVWCVQLTGFSTFIFLSGEIATLKPAHGMRSSVLGAQHSINFSTWRRKPLPNCCSFHIMN
jgi:hypothetical protein